MKFSIRFADQVVGALVILALAILIVVVFMLGRNQRWFVRDPQYLTYLDSVTGLSKNMAVQYKGFTIGSVKDFSLSQDDSVEVVFSIYKEHSHRVTEGSVVELRASPIGLGNSFHFYPGRGIEPLEEGSVLPEVNSKEAMDYMAAGMSNRPETNDSIGNIISNIENITTDLNNVISGIVKQLEPVFSNLETISDQAASPYGTVMSILDAEGPIYTDITDAISSLAGIIENLEKTSEFIPSQLPQIAVILSDLSIAIRSAQDVLTAVANNPLLRGGVPQRVETSPGGTNPRNLEF